MPFFRTPFERRSLFYVEMPVFYKKVHAVQLNLSLEEFEELSKGARIEWEAQVIRYAGGTQYFVILLQGENQIKVNATQWVVRHPDGLWQVLWPHEFEENFIEAVGENVQIKEDPFLKKSFNQPTVVI